MTTRRRPTDWQTTLVSFDIAAASTSQPDLLKALTVADLRTATVTRIIVDIWCQGIDTGSDAMLALDMGIGLVNRDNFTQGDLPDPSSETDEPITGWLYRTRVMVLTDASESTRGSLPARVQGDFRGQRKVGNGILFMKFDNTAVLGTGTVRLLGIVRVLVLL